MPKLYAFIVEHTPSTYRKVRAIPRLSIGVAMMAGIVVGILLDINDKPIEYVREAVVETAQAEEKKVPVMIEIRIDWTEERINKEIGTLAKKYKVDAEVMKTVVWCESRYNKEAVGDGGKSHGLVQIHQGYHPYVTTKQAQDPAFALEFLAEKLSKKQGYLWSCYNMNYGV